MLTIAQVAEKLQVSEGLVRRWVAQKQLPHYRLGRRIRIAPADLEGFLAPRRQAPLPVTWPPPAPGFMDYYEAVMAQIARKAASSPRGRRGHGRTFSQSSTPTCRTNPPPP